LAKFSFFINLGQTVKQYCEFYRHFFFQNNLDEISRPNFEYSRKWRLLYEKEIGRSIFSLILIQNESLIVINWCGTVLRYRLTWTILCSKNFEKKNLRIFFNRVRMVKVRGTSNYLSICSHCNN